MVQFKDVFLGKDKRPYTRATTSQKCVRAGGKHNDLENVGFTARHHTFFEMLGNFSFGDYFKKEAIHFAWEFVTKELEAPEGPALRHRFREGRRSRRDLAQAGRRSERPHLPLRRKRQLLGDGRHRPVRPCSEIFIDRGEKYSCGKPTCAMGCDCDRYMEFWNLSSCSSSATRAESSRRCRSRRSTPARASSASPRFSRTSTRTTTPTLFSTSSRETAKLAGKPYDRTSETAVSFRVIADHSRATAFLIGDGVLPSNEGRGYVLRRIMRRAIRHGKKLGFNGPFLHKTAGFVIEQMNEAYPDLVDKRAFIEKAVLGRRRAVFPHARAAGSRSSTRRRAKLRRQSKTLPGEVAFKLYDTFGFPLDLTRVICAEKGIDGRRSGLREMRWTASAPRARKNWKGSGERGAERDLSEARRTSSKPRASFRSSWATTQTQAHRRLPRDPASPRETALQESRFLHHSRPRRDRRQR